MPFQICLKKYERADFFNKHLKTHRSDDDSVVIEDSEDDTETPATTPRVRDKNFPCDKCDKTFRSPSELGYHQRRHTGERPHSCHICSKSFFGREHLSTHMKGVHNSTVMNDGSSKHTKGSTPDDRKPHQCPSCPRAFKSQAELGFHKRKHQASDDSDSEADALEPPRKYAKLTRTQKSDYHQCITCYKSFSDEDELKTHERTHIEKRPYECKECDASYWCKWQLNQHSKTHGGTDSGSSTPEPSQKPPAVPASSPKRECPTCHRVFHSLEKLKQHRKANHSGERPFQCPYCPRSYFVQSVLNAHVKGVHSSD